MSDESTSTLLAELSPEAMGTFDAEGNYIPRTITEDDLGGAPLGRAALRVTIGGALAMTVTALIGKILGVSVG